MSLINTTLVVQVDESINLPSIDDAATANNSLGASNAAAKTDGSLVILVDGAFEQTPAEAGANELIKLCTFHAGDKGATVFTSSSEFKIGEITDVAYSETVADAAGTDLDFNSFAYYESGTENSSTLRKDAILGSGSLKGVREQERLSAISSGAYNQETYDKVNPASNTDTGQDFCSYTITVRKKVAKNYVTEIIRVYINHTNAFTKAALQTTLGLGNLADITPPVVGTSLIEFAEASYSIGTPPSITIDIVTAETGGTYSFTLTTNDDPVYTRTYNGSLDSSGDRERVIQPGAGSGQFDWDQTAEGSTITITGFVKDVAGNQTNFASVPADMVRTIQA